MSSAILAIAIPTYNRADVLKQNLQYMMEDIKAHNIPIYISDDSTNDDTSIMLDELKKDYPNIYYKKNLPSLGHDNNCFETLRMPNEKYVWYLGDSIYIKRGVLTKVIKLLSEDYDLLVFNNSLKTRKHTPDAKVYTEADDVLIDLAWYMTFTGATVYKRSLIDDVHIKSYYKNFPQLAISMYMLGSGGKQLYWLDDKVLLANQNKKSYWMNDVIDVFAYDWCRLILELPMYHDMEKKLIAIKSHSFNTEVFGWKKMLRYRSEGIYSLDVYSRYKQHLIMASHESNVNLLMIALLPRLVVKGLFVMANYVRKEFISK